MDQRLQHRIAVHYRLMVRHADSEGPGMTENLSERGSMMSVDIDPPLAPGDLVTVTLELPAGSTQVAGTVRWTSAVLPGMTGVEFTQPVPPELLRHVAKLMLAIDF